MRVPIDRASPEPLYRQLEAHLRRAISAGRLPAGERLPSTRSLARDLGVNRLTVETAYAELEADGLVRGRHGSGTYVLAASPRVPPRATRPASWPAWQDGPWPAARARRSSAGVPAGRAPALRLDHGWGDPRLFPTEPFRRALQATLRAAGPGAYGYGDPAGFLPLRRMIAQLLTSQGIPVRAEDVVATSGSQRALSLVASVLTRPGDRVLVERPSYGGALELFSAHGLELVGVPMDERGLRVDALPALVERHHPRFLYTMPTYQNPSGVSLAPSRRAELVSLAAAAGLAILEDDFVGDLRYEGRAQPALAALDRGGHVIYVSTFSKMLMPGLRAGFVVAHGPIVAALRERQRVEELAPSSLVQHALEAYVSVGRYEAHLRRAVRIYRQRRDALVGALRRHLPRTVSFDVPSGGLFLWIRLPEGIASSAVARAAWSAGVAVAPGGAFFAEPAEGERFLRLCFSALTTDEHEDAARRLGSVVTALGGSRA